MEAQDHLPLAWITGAGGLIGHELVQSAQQWAAGWNIRGLQRAELDITSHAQVQALYAAGCPKLIVHCAAISKSVACDANRELAARTNVDATRALAEIAAQSRIVFFSTDLVFDGRKGHYTEDDPPNPLLFYGETKARAEEALRGHPNCAIVRISLTGGHSPTRDRGFNEEMKKAWRAGKTLDLFTDEFRSPMAAPVTARAVWELALSSATGVFHLCAPERLSRWQIGEHLVRKHPEFARQIRAGSRRDYKGPERPADTTMNPAKIQQLLSFPLPRFSDWLRADDTGF
jgi:dTDP-4-dehydrorhamnose reductase